MKKKNKEIREIEKKSKGFFSEFKAFIQRGNAFDLAIAVVIGNAFSKIVTSLVNDILMPFISLLLQSQDFSGLSLTIGKVNINYGIFIQNIVDRLFNYNGLDLKCFKQQYDPEVNRKEESRFKGFNLFNKKKLKR